MARILVIAGDFVEDYEIMVPFQCLLAFGHDVSVVCPNKNSGDTIKTAIHDFEGDQTYTEKPGHNFVLNASFASIKASEFDALLIPGGRAPEYLRLDADVLDMVSHFLSNNKPTAAVCHGAQLLCATGLVEGREISAYPACAPELKACGATYIDINVDQAHTQGNIVSAPAWPAHPQWLAQFEVLLKTI
ncbi:DJ-1/PfpI family protein [Alginatibacterium sediminis]|uniref:DJ-1/PfpI family protein n=1 Tax=Alginatibacterium sediminis TaxID=2164068 RepID=A0A420EHS0_9ALTE|nr:DJ-1/PfpI family protein [Alginatibacterium sediminis]RKF20106.1 DJ-1/PfpI family protein [Alginatibacterium sediminis]